MSKSLRIGVIGGSISGCATAALLSAAGHKVTVFERSPGQLASRGLGIAASTAVIRQMIERGLLDEGFPECPRVVLDNVCRGDVGERGERWLGGFTMDRVGVNWAHLYENLRRRVSDAIVRSGVSVVGIDSAATSVTLQTDDERSEAFELVVCADGFRSIGRKVVAPGSALRYRGFVLWRGLVADTDPDVAHLEDTTVRILYPGGHGVAYLIPGLEGGTTYGGRLAMWGFYLQVPSDQLHDMLADSDGRQWTASVPLGKVHPTITAALRGRMGAQIPPTYADLIDRTEQSSIQAIFSTEVPSYYRGRICLVGDAGAVFPPFTGSGVFKAMTNASDLADALASDLPVDQALSRWSDDQQRLASSVSQQAQLVERHLIFDVPDLFSMTLTDSNAWMQRAYPNAPLALPH